jgi:hypothetical protein
MYDIHNIHDIYGQAFGPPGKWDTTCMIYMIYVNTWYVYDIHDVHNIHHVYDIHNILDIWFS